MTALIATISLPYVWISVVKHKIILVGREIRSTRSQNFISVIVLYSGESIKSVESNVASMGNILPSVKKNIRASKCATTHPLPFVVTGAIPEECTKMTKLMEFNVRGNPELTSKYVGSQVRAYITVSSITALLQTNIKPNVLTTRFLRARKPKDTKLFQSMDEETGTRGVPAGLIILKREHRDPERTR